MTPLYLKHMSQMGEMPDLAESQTSLKQVAKGHPGYCLKFIDTRSTQHQPLSQEFRGKVGLTLLQSHVHRAGQTYGHNLYFPCLDRCPNGKRHTADGDRSPPQAVFNSALTPPPALLHGGAPHIPEDGRRDFSGRKPRWHVTQALPREGTDIRSRVQSGPAGAQDRVSRALLRGLGPQLELGMEPRPGGAPGGW